MRWNLIQNLIILGTFFLLVGFHTVLSQNTLGSYGVPEEPLITPETDNQRQAEEQHEEHGGDGGHHHHSDNPLDWLRASVPGAYFIWNFILAKIKAQVVFWFGVV